MVPSGGVALIRAKDAIAKLKGDNVDQETGIKLVLRAVESPLRTIVANAGDEPSVVVNNVASGKGNYGYNAATGEYGDLVDQGVLDRSEEHTSELQSLMRTSYAVFCLNKKSELVIIQHKTRAEIGMKNTITNIQK